MSLSASVELFSALSLFLSLSLSLSHTHNHLHTHTRGGMMLVQVYDLQHSGLLLLKTGLSVAKMCETFVLSPRPVVVQGKGQLLSILSRMRIWWDSLI